MMRPEFFLQEIDVPLFAARSSVAIVDEQHSHLAPSPSGRQFGDDLGRGAF
jgi:hypothetical protein